MNNKCHPADSVTVSTKACMPLVDYGKRWMFDGVEITSDAGVPLRREQAHRIRLLERMADCFGDRRDPTMTVHTPRRGNIRRVQVSGI